MHARQALTTEQHHNLCVFETGYDYVVWADHEFKILLSTKMIGVYHLTVLFSSKFWEKILERK
jgi:hypothetical protein